MQLRLSTRRRLLPLVILALCVMWAGGYVFEAVNDPFGGDEATLFIEPLFYLLTATAIWSAIEALFHNDQKQREASPSRASSVDNDEAFGATGLADYRRLALVLSLPAMVIATSFLGFVLSAAAYVMTLSLALNERRWVFLLLLALLAIATVWLFFKTLLGVPLPLWPKLPD